MRKLFHSHLLPFIALSVISSQADAQTVTTSNLLEYAIPAASESSEFNSPEAFYQKWIVCDAEGNRITDTSSYVSEYSKINDNWTATYDSKDYQLKGGLASNPYLEQGSPLVVFDFKYSATNYNQNFVNYSYPLEVPLTGRYAFTGGIVRVGKATNKTTPSPTTAITSSGYLIIVAAKDLSPKDIRLKQGSDGVYKLSVTDQEGRNCSFIYAPMPALDSDNYGSFSDTIDLTTDTKYLSVYGPSWLPALGGLTLCGLSTGIEGITDIESEKSETMLYYDMQGRQLSAPSGLCIEKRGNQTRKIISR